MTCIACNGTMTVRLQPDTLVDCGLCSPKLNQAYVSFVWWLCIVFGAVLVGHSLGGC